MNSRQRVNRPSGSEEKEQDTETELGDKNQTEEEKEASAVSEEPDQSQTILDDPDQEEEEDRTQASGEIHPSYTIQRGDTITKISIKTYGSTDKVREICELNHLSVNDLIYPGQKILLP